MSFIAKDVIRLHGLKIGIDKDAVSMPILRSMLQGWYEAVELTLMKKVLTPGDRIVEVGGGIGITAMKAADIIGAENIFSFELNPYLIEWSADNFKRNGFEIQVFQQALFPRASLPDGLVDFHVHQNFWASSLAPREGTVETIKVPAACLEDKIAEHRANVLIVDIEGAEVHLFNGLDLTGIEKIVMEIHYRAAGRTETNAMIRSIEDRGFFLDYEMIDSGVLCFTRTADAQT
ncbi:MULTISPECIES: FkbM family methyltransferase [Kordiimonas]|mgnify:CR=1 FL=1|jgi:FkbM family methyltransferase|uniref:FkbM family methyltransferase n=1 Tax=Kordiimonas TaxID=288021 RepID=UPI00257BA111|nr:FkbM family methyltransferase [Kordiimonas sp. UBA4487]